MKVGDKISEKKKVDKYAPYYYAGASLDFNPIHLDSDFAKSVGLSGNILHGLCTMAYLYKGIIGDKDPSKLKKLRVRFRQPVFPLDELTIKGEVTGVEGNLAGIELSVENQTGEQVITNGFAVYLL